ncbi:hybrid sensor histidine kinase/response regulator [Desulforhopalus sp. 52FAK]
MSAKTFYQYSLFQNIGLPLVVLNEDCSVVTANQQFLDLLGCSHQQLQAGYFHEIENTLCSEQSRPLLCIDFFKGCVECIRSRVFSKTIGVNAGDGGGLKWFKVTLSTSENTTGREKHTIVTLTDITEIISSKDSHSKIVQAKNEWETTVDALQDIVTIQNMDMEIVRANKVAHELFGYELGGLKNKKCYQAFLGQDEPCSGCPVTKTGLDSCPHTGLVYNEHVNKTFQVSSFPIISESGRMHQLVHVAKDVSQYLKDELEKNQLMAAIEQTSDSVVMTDIHSNIQYVNPAFERSSGYSKEEAVGKNARILKSGEHEEHFYQLLWNTLLSKQVWRGKLINRHKNGEIYVEYATISPVLNGDGDIVNFVALKRNITREEQLEQQLQHATRIEALGTLAGGIAHDFNNILSSMIGYGEIARGKLDLNHPVQPDLQQILDGGDRAVDLVKQILTFSRSKASGEFSVVKMQHVITESIEFLRPSLPSTIDFVHAIDMNCGSVYADSSQLYQVIMNLCTNARQAIGGGHGTISITLKEVCASDADANSTLTYPEDPYLLLEVSDNGCGIEQEDLPKLFDPFFTTKPKEQGTGLGLAVVHGIIQKHNGKIKVESTPGTGTTFSIYLPLDGRALKGERVQVESKKGGNEKIMVIDDEVQVANVTASCLKNVGYRVSTYNDSMQAVMAFRDDPYCCDLVITDMLMPNMTGAELSREMLSIRKDLPIIMMTGYSEHFDRKRSEQIGLKEYLFKPVRNKVLRQIVRKVLENG